MDGQQNAMYLLNSSSSVLTYYVNHQSKSQILNTFQVLNNVRSWPILVTLHCLMPVHRFQPSYNTEETTERHRLPNITASRCLHRSWTTDTATNYSTFLPVSFTDTILLMNHSFYFWVL